MNINEGLTKEGYFDDIVKLYPLAGKEFLDYINEYKASVNWFELFNDFPAGTSTDCDIEFVAPKFHEIPYHLQLGIIDNFFLLRGLACDIFPNGMFKPNRDNFWRAVVNKIFAKEEWYLYKDKTCKELEDFPEASEAKIACFKMAFAVLEQMIEGRKQLLN